MKLPDMPERVASDRATRHYRGRGPVTRALRRLFSSASDEAAHQRQLRIERDFFQLCALLRHDGQQTRLIGYQTRLLDLLDDGTGTIPTIRTAVRDEGSAGRLQDAAAERLLLDLVSATTTMANLCEIERRTRGQIAAGYRLLLAVRQRTARVRESHLQHAPERD